MKVGRIVPLPWLKVACGPFGGPFECKAVIQLSLWIKSNPKSAIWVIWWWNLAGYILGHGQRDTGPFGLCKHKPSLFCSVKIVIFSLGRLSLVTPKLQQASVYYLVIFYFLPVMHQGGTVWFGAKTADYHHDILKYLQHGNVLRINTTAHILEAEFNHQKSGPWKRRAFLYL